MLTTREDERRRYLDSARRAINGKEQRPARQVMVIGAEILMGRPGDHSSDVVYF